ncbi:MAG: DUF4138 domain-containing protein, partial [Bacteroidota bacterium]
MRKLTSMGIAMLFYLQVTAQNTIIQIMENQTSHLIFPSDIIYTDIGDNQHFIIEYTNNILRVKGVKTIKQTNLTVLTKDQHFYSFYVMYLENPQLNYFITQRMATKVLSANKSPPTLPTTSQIPTKTASRRVNLSINRTDGGAKPNSIL